jgi:hypothetical protein
MHAVKACGAKGCVAAILTNKKYANNEKAVYV